MTRRPQSLAKSSIEIAAGTLGAIAIPQGVCWGAGLPLGESITLTAGIYAGSFMWRLLVRRWFKSRART